MIAECQRGGGGDFLIKLFGKTIPVPESGGAKDLQQSSSSSSSTDAHALEKEKEHEHAYGHPDSSDPSPQPEVVDAEDPKSCSLPETTHQKEKLKKPDKVLPCPRCNSMDTKFCYFNNYNVNQPRHFCKKCQRYWTAGGAMRNVPVGAGRRKNKNAVAAACSHFLHKVRAALPADTFKTTNGTVLSFGHGHGGGPPAACLDLAEQLSHLAPVRIAAGDPPGPCSEGSSNDDTGDNKTNNNDSRSSLDEAEAVQQHPASMNNGATTVWPPYTPAAYFSSSGIAIPIYPAAAASGYWGCMVPGAWSLPWPVQVQQHPSQSQAGPGLSSSSSPTTTSAPSVSSSGAADSQSSHTLGLGKHPRDCLEGDDGRRNGNCNANKVWAPKTIRIDEVDEVARSSIWSLIGIKGDKQQDADAAGGGHNKQKQQLGMVFEPKREATKKQGMMMTSSSPLLHANPVALTRSVAFQEGS